FVFQAGDGIRDRNVTGVQTCALPIYTYARLLASPGLLAGLASYKGVIELKFPDTRPAGSWSYVQIDGDVSLLRALLGGSLGELRSEERRVGKESRSVRSR